MLEGSFLEGDRRCLKFARAVNDMGYIVMIIMEEQPKN